MLLRHLPNKLASEITSQQQNTQESQKKKMKSTLYWNKRDTFNSTMSRVGVQVIFGSDNETMEVESTDNENFNMDPKWHAMTPHPISFA